MYKPKQTEERKKKIPSPEQLELTSDFYKVFSLFYVTPMSKQLHT